MNTKYIIANPAVIFLAVRSLVKRGFKADSVRLQMEFTPDNNQMRTGLQQAVAQHELMIKRETVPKWLNSSILASELSATDLSSALKEASSRSNMANLPIAEQEFLRTIAAPTEDLELKRLSFNPVRNNPLRFMLTTRKMADLMNDKAKDYNPSLIRRMKEVARKLGMEFPALVYRVYYTEICTNANLILETSVQAMRKDKLGESDAELHRIHRQMLSIKNSGKYVSTTWADMTNEVTRRMESKDWTVKYDGREHRISFAPSAGAGVDDSKGADAA